MKINCEKFKTALQKKFGTFIPALDRRYNFTFTLKRKRDADTPLLRANFNGEIPKEWVAFLALVGLFTLLAAIFKLIRIFHR